MKKIILSGVLQPYANSKSELVTEADTVIACLREICHDYDGLRPYILSAHNEIQAFTNVYVNGKDIRTLDNSQTPLVENDIVEIIPSMSGG